MHWWQAIILGLVEGITEYLPVSSTGHLIIAESLLGLGRDPRSHDAVSDFAIVIQGGAILAVVGLYRARFVQMLKGLAGRDADGWKLLVNLVIAFIPAAAVGLVLHSTIKRNLFYPGPVVAAFILGGLYMIAVEQWRRGRFSPPTSPNSLKNLEQMTAKDALLVGLVQCISMWPGTSRSMMTITGGLFARLKPVAAAEFSFLLGVPTLLAATGLSLYKNLSEAKKTGGENLFQQLGMGAVLLGIVVSAISAAFAVKWLVGFLNRRGLEPFGWYRILIGVALIGMIVGGVVTIAPEVRAGADPSRPGEAPIKTPRPEAARTTPSP